MQRRQSEFATTEILSSAIPGVWIDMQFHREPPSGLESPHTATLPAAPLTVAALWVVLLPRVENGVLERMKARASVVAV